MKKSFFYILIICFSALYSNILDRIVAVVGDDIILSSEVEQYVEQKRMFGFGGNDDELRNTAIDELISVKILYDIAKRDTTISVSDEEVQRILESRINPIIQQVGGEKKFEEIYKTTIPELKRHYRTETRKSIMVDRLRNKQSSRITASRRDVENFYELYKDSIPPVKPSVTLSQLVINFSDDTFARTNALNKISSLREDIVSKKISFEKAAEEHSDDTTSKLSGGNIGFTTRGDLVPEYERAAYNLDRGDISAPVRTQFGYHIIRLEEKIGERINTSHILITPRPSQDLTSDALEFAVAVRDSVMNKKMTFEEAVRKHSNDEKTRSRDGFVGVLNFEDLDKRYLEVFQNAEIGFITDPLMERNGYHIYKVLDRKSGHKISIDSDYNILLNLATEHKRELEMKKWIDEMRKKVYIEMK